MGLFTRKPLSASCQQSATHSTKNLSWFHLLAYGISATIGSGIYVTIGVTAKSITGPAVILSILLAGALSSLTALCYLELSNIVPASGSSYSWGVTFLGEGLGWLLGWISTLEYAFAGSCTAVAISQYISTLSPYLSPIPLAQSFTSPDTYLLVFNFVALLIIVLVSPVVLLGISFGTNVNNLMATANITVLVCIVAIGCFYVVPANWTPFFLTGPSGSDGAITLSASEQVVSGALIMIYSFLGFDTICVFVADAISPRHVQIAVLGTLALATTLYMLVGLVITGMVPISMIDANTPLSSAFLDCGLYVVHIIIKICALCMLLATLLACLLGQPKIFQVISLDGLLPKIFSSGSKGTGSVPFLNALICCALSAVMATFFNVYSLVEIISTGALLTFTTNASTVIVAKTSNAKKYILVPWFVGGNLLTWLLHQHLASPLMTVIFGSVSIGIPLMGLIWICHAERTKKDLTANLEHYDIEGASTTFCPWMPLIPCLSIVGNTFIMSTVELLTWVQLLSWIFVGVCIYLIYGYKHSNIGSFIDSTAITTTVPRPPIGYFENK